MKYIGNFARCLYFAEKNNFIMKTYVKNKSEKLWHWMPECPRYPKGTKTEKSKRNPGENFLCSRCRLIESSVKTARKTREMIDDDSLN